MQALITQFDQIVSFATQMGMPSHKKRGIIREYLQTKFIHDLYAHREADQLVFVGGTSLRLLRNIPRFSEDLDFDNLGLRPEQIHILLEGITARWNRENLAVELVTNRQKAAWYAELRFPHLLSELKISTNPKEKLRIKVDYGNWWRGQQPEQVLCNRFGLIQQVVTNPLNQILVQKLTAYVRRPQTQARDVYDVVWLFAQGARLDQDFMQVNRLKGIGGGVEVDLLTAARTKLASEGVTDVFRRRLQPFLFDEAEVAKIDLFGRVLGELVEIGS